MAPYLGREREQLEQAVRLLRLLPDDADGMELMAPGEILGDPGLLIRVQGGLEDVVVDTSFADGTPAVRADRTVFLRSLALIQTGAAERAVSSGAGAVGVQASGTDGPLVLYVSPVPGDGEGGGGGRG